MSGSTSKKVSLVFLFLVLAAIPSFSFLRNFEYYFNSEWIVAHFWPLQAYALHLRATGDLPSVISGKRSLFNLWSVFYAPLYYPSMGYIAKYFGTNFVMRTIVYFLFLLQALLAWVLLRRSLFSNKYSIVLATIFTFIVVSSTYPLTVLYSRGAFAEFVASRLVTCSIFVWMLIPLSLTFLEETLFTCLTAFCIAFALGTHAITALYGGLFFSIIVSLSFLSADRRKAKQRIMQLGTVGIVTAVFNAPFVYEYYLHSKHLLTSSAPRLVMNPLFDQFWVRLMPFPFDKRALLYGTTIDTPYLDLQVCMPAIILCVLLAAFFKKMPSAVWEKIHLVLLSGLGSLLFWMSYSEIPYKVLPRFFLNIQFPYRLISYVDLCAFLIAIALLKQPNKSEKRANLFPLALTFVVTLSVCSLGLKTIHNEAIKAPFRVFPENFQIEMPNGFFGNSFASNEFQELDSTTKDVGSKIEFLPQLSAPGMESAQPITLRLSEGTWIPTNISAFAWNHLSVDSVELNQTTLKMKDGHLAVNVPKGTHILRAWSTPDLLWKKLRMGAVVSAGILFSIIIALGCAHFRRWLLVS